MRTIKLMADYQCFPLWEASPGIVGNIDPEDLPISSSLQQRLMAWAEKYTATLDMDDPPCSGFESEQEASEFRQEGEVLVQCLREELGVSYAVTKNIMGSARRMPAAAQSPAHPLSVAETRCRNVLFFRKVLEMFGWICC
jgi:hypothetical protein